MGLIRDQWSKATGMFKGFQARDIRGWFFLALAVLLFVASIAGGLYVWLGWGWVGGIVGIVEAFQAAPVYAPGIAWGVVKIMVAAPLGWITFAFTAMVARGVLEFA